MCKIYEYGRIGNLARSLEKAGIDGMITDQIMEGGELIRNHEKPEKKADWMREAMRRMDMLLDAPTRHAVREACACCLGGKRLQLSKAIAKEHHTLEERIHAANETRLVFGHSVTLQEDGKVMVRFGPDDLPEYRCPCMPKSRQPISITHCYCCGGHVKHHLQTALQRKLEVKVVSSALSSGGKRTCAFLFTFVEN